jgi:hypothetical protein
MHVYVRLNGWGLKILPTGDFDASWDEAARNLDIKRCDGKFARIHPDDGGYVSQVNAQTTQDVHEVADIFFGEAGPHWWLETSLCRFVWPAGYRIACRAAEIQVTPLDLLGPGGECIFIQHPRAMPPLEKMVGPGQEILDQDDATRAVLLGYLLEGEEWRQRHTVVTVGSRELAITGQAPGRAFAGVERVMREIASTIEVTPGW